MVPNDLVWHCTGGVHGQRETPITVTEQLACLALKRSKTRVTCPVQRWMELHSYKALPPPNMSYTVLYLVFTMFPSFQLTCHLETGTCPKHDGPVANGILISNKQLKHLFCLSVSLVISAMDRCHLAPA